MNVYNDEVNSCDECQYFWMYEGDGYPCCSYIYDEENELNGFSTREKDSIEDYVENGISKKCPFLR